LAINPPSDIVLDVAKAADPLRYTAAVQKLSQIAGAAEVDESFDLLLGALDSASDSPAAQTFDWTRADLRSRLAPLSATIAASPTVEPYRQFEAFVLQSFIQSMFPKDANHVFGDGIAGSYWSSMLAEQVAGQVAKSGGIGIADQLASSHPAAPDAGFGRNGSIGDPGLMTPDLIPSKWES